MKTLKSIRKKRGLTQIQMADMLGISQPYLAELESEKKKPSHTLLLKMANRLGVTVSELVGEKLQKEG